MMPTQQLGQFGRTVSSGAGSPYWSYVVLLLHFDGSNGSSTITDSSQYVRTVTSGGANRVLTTSNPKFGTASGLSTASGSQAYSVTDNDAWHFAAGQFTVEAWIRWTTAPVSGNYEQIAGQTIVAGSSRSWSLGMTSGNLNFYYSTGGTAINRTIGAAFSPTLNQWYHIAVDRDAANTIRVYIDGSIHASASVGSDSIFNSTSPLRIAGDSTWWGFAGQIDDLRITNGYAWYAGAFTPPTTAFPDF